MDEITAIGIIAFYSVSSLIVWLYFKHMYDRMASLKDPMQRHQTNAQIKQKIHGGSQGASSYQLICEFSDWRGELFAHKTPLSKEAWDTYEQGQEIAIIYNKSDPRISCAVDAVEARLKPIKLPLIMIPVGSVLSVCVLVYALLLQP